MRKHRHRLGRSLLLTLFLVWGLLSWVAGPTVRAAPSAQFVDQQVAVQFPTALTFSLHAVTQEPVTRVELRYHPVSSIAITVVRPPFTPSLDLHIQYTRDMQVNYLPPGTEISYVWRLYFADGSWVESPEQHMLYLDQRYQWSMVQDARVQIYAAVADPAYRQAALAIVEQTIDQLGQQLNVTIQGPVRVVLYPSAQALASALPPASAEWVGGMALPELQLILGGVPAGNMQELRRILTHEVVHLAVAQLTENPYNTPPPWLDEGLATFFQQPQDARFPPLLRQAVQRGQLIPLQALNSSFPADPTAALLSYAESESVVQYIMRTYGGARLGVLLRSFQQGVTYDEAVQQSLGVTIDQLDQAWESWVRSQYGGGVSAVGDLSRLVLAAGLPALVFIGGFAVRRARHRGKERGRVRP